MTRLRGIGSRRCSGSQSQSGGESTLFSVHNSTDQKGKGSCHCQVFYLQRLHMSSLRMYCHLPLFCSEKISFRRAKRPLIDQLNQLINQFNTIPFLIRNPKSRSLTLLLTKSVTACSVAASMLMFFLFLAFLGFLLVSSTTPSSSTSKSKLPYRSWCFPLVPDPKLPSSAKATAARPPTLLSEGFWTRTECSPATTRIYIYIYISVGGG